MISIIFLSLFYLRGYGKEDNFYKTNSYEINGDYIYGFRDNEVKILKINEGKLEFLSSVFEGEMFETKIKAVEDKIFLSGIKKENGKSLVNVFIYDVYDKKNPVKINEFSVEGNNYLFSEKDDVIYLLLKEGENSKIISIDLKSSEVSLKVQELHGTNPSFLYISEDDFYVICNENDIDSRKCSIYKFHVDGDILTYVDKSYIEGNVLNNKYIYEFEDNLRVISSLSNNKNNIYIFDEELKVINLIENEIEGINNIYFNKDLCYISNYLDGYHLTLYDFRDNKFNEVSKLDLLSPINQIIGIKEGEIILISNENRNDTYKNFQSDRVYEIIKNIGIRVNLIKIDDKNDLNIIDDYLIRGKQIYSPSFIDEGKLLYLQDKNILIFLLDSMGLNNDLEINSIMEVNNNFYKNILDNRGDSFNGIYGFNVKNGREIGLQFIINYYKEFKIFDYIDVEHMEVYKDYLFVFTKDNLKVFNFEGKSIFSFEFKK